MNTNDQKEYLKRMVNLSSKNYDIIINTIEQLKENEIDQLYSFVQGFKFENSNIKVYISNLDNIGNILSICVSSSLNIIKS